MTDLVLAQPLKLSKFPEENTDVERWTSKVLCVHRCYRKHNVNDYRHLTYLWSDKVFAVRIHR